jgi:hypothetical protein
MGRGEAVSGSKRGRLRGEKRSASPRGLFTKQAIEARWQVRTLLGCSQKSEPASSTAEKQPRGLLQLFIRLKRRVSVTPLPQVARASQSPHRAHAR